MPRIDLKNCTLTFQDGTPTTPLTASIKIGDGTLTWDEKRPLEYLLNRGVLDTVRLANQEPMDVKIDAVFDYLKADTSKPASPADVFYQRGVCSAWVSTDSDTCAPYAVNIIILHTPICATEKTETITLPYFRHESISHDPKTGMLTITGKCNAIVATVIRTAQS